MRAGRPLGPTPPLDLALEARVQAVCREAIAAGWVRAAHDVSDGGLAVTLAEMCLAGDLGATLEWDVAGRADLALFGEGGSRIVLEVTPTSLPAIERLAREREVPWRVLGRVSDAARLSLRLRQGASSEDEHSSGNHGHAGRAAARVVGLPLDALRAQWEEAIPCAMR